VLTPILSVLAMNDQEQIERFTLLRRLAKEGHLMWADDTLNLFKHIDQLNETINRLERRISSIEEQAAIRGWHFFDY
jgi:hypothetical protein